MTLRRKMGAQIAAMIVGLLVVSGMALWGLDAQHEDYGLALAGYQQLRQVFEIGSHLTRARTLLSGETWDRAGARSEVEFADFELSHPSISDPNRSRPAPTSADIELKASLDQAVVQLRSPPELQTSEDPPAADARAVSNAIGKVGALAASIRENIEAHQRSAVHRRIVTTRAVAGVSLAIVFAAIVLGFAQYRAVMSPLGRLRAGVGRIASGQFAQRLSPRGDSEFIELAEEFNRMAAQLNDFYNQLEQKVAQKSKELIRSERLASVGFLAAGVAHEINNPLSIISGYAEYSLEQLRRDGRADPASAETRAIDDDLERSLRIICDEAFRCKDITTRLLSLARQGNENRQRVDLAQVAAKVVSIIGGLKEYQDRSLRVTTAARVDGKSVCVHAIEAEMQQVLLNLVLNALDASAADGEVTISIGLTNGDVELCVADKGRGMSPQTLERVFEPFYTEKRSVDVNGSRWHGTGLGLSITHAIVTDHGGSISAHSDGVGKGSRFVVRLPACEASEVERSAGG